MSESERVFQHEFPSDPSSGLSPAKDLMGLQAYAHHQAEDVLRMQDLGEPHGLPCWLAAGPAKTPWAASAPAMPLVIVLASACAMPSGQA